MKQIVVGVDGSEGAQRALEWAVDEASAHGAKLTAVHAWSVVYAGGALPYAYNASPIDASDFEKHATEVLDTAIAALPVHGVAIESHVVCGGAADALLKAAKGADLLVVGSRGRGGFSALLLGSVSHQVAQHAPCPVVVIPPPAD